MRTEDDIRNAAEAAERLARKANDDVAEGVLHGEGLIRANKDPLGLDPYGIEAARREGIRAALRWVLGHDKEYGKEALYE